MKPALAAAAALLSLSPLAQAAPLRGAAPARASGPAALPAPLVLPAPLRLNVPSVGGAADPALLRALQDPGYARLAAGLAGAPETERRLLEWVEAQELEDASVLVREDNIALYEAFRQRLVRPDDSGLWDEVRAWVRDIDAFVQAHVPGEELIPHGAEVRIQPKPSWWWPQFPARHQDPQYMTATYALEGPGTVIRAEPNGPELQAETRGLTLLTGLWRSFATRPRIPATLHWAPTNAKGRRVVLIQRYNATVKR